MPGSPKNQIAAPDLSGLVNMTVDAIVGITDLTEAVHMRILGSTGKVGAPVHKPLAMATSLVYKSVRGISSLVGTGLDGLLARLAPLLSTHSHWPGREPVLSALNGVLGDYLAASHNPLAIPLRLRHQGQVLALNADAIAQILDPAMPAAHGRILILAHGLCMNDLQWQRKGHDHGAMLARERQYTPIYLHYNTGQHISSNGQLFADQLQALVQAWPVPIEEIVLLCHSMGGLVSRSAFHYGTLAKHQWVAQVKKIIFLATPHHGSPLERGGNWVHILTDLSSYSAPFSRLAKIRSSGITDLRYGNLLDADWHGKDRFAHGGDPRNAVPLPTGVACYTVAATTGKKKGDLTDSILADGLVPLASALGQHEDGTHSLNFAPERQAVVYGTHHFAVLDSPEVAQKLLEWLVPADFLK